MLLLGRLAVHYYRPDFTPAAAKSMVEDMAGDLEEFTIAELEVAIRAYRTNPERKFFPRSADLRDLVLGERKHRRSMGDGKQRGPEFGESRPLMWWARPKASWQSNWSLTDLNAEQRSQYDLWNREKTNAR